ncbi:MAG: four helix bundle protein [Chitinophagaceae bacterium]
MGTYSHFYQLPVYLACRQFRKKIAVITAAFFPKTEGYRLKDQVLRASRSVTANIAEGFGRFHYQENIQFCRQSRGSLCETFEHMITAFDEKYIPVVILSEIKQEYEHCLRQINGYIKYLKTAKKEIG